MTHAPACDWHTDQYVWECTCKEAPMQAEEVTVTQLLPCPKPWCRGEAEIQQFVCILNPGAHIDRAVACKTCSCGTPVCCTEAEAVGLWNTRHQPAPSEDVVERVRRAVASTYHRSPLLEPEEARAAVDAVLSPIPTNREKVLEEALRKREDMTIGPISADLHGVMVRFTDPGAAGKFFKALQALRSTPEGEEG